MGRKSQLKPLEPGHPSQCGRSEQVAGEMAGPWAALGGLRDAGLGFRPVPIGFQSGPCKADGSWRVVGPTTATPPARISTAWCVARRGSPENAQGCEDSL